MNNMRKHFRLSEEFTYGTLLIQSAYLPVGQTPADGDWETDHTYDWDSPQETLRTLLSELSEVHQEIARLADSKEGDAKAARHVETTMTRDRAELTAFKARYNELGAAYGQLKGQLDGLRNDLRGTQVERDQLRAGLKSAEGAIESLKAALTEANNQRNELRSQLVTAQKAAEANPIYMSAMERDNLLVQLDEMLTADGKNSNTNRVNAFTLIRRNAVPMRLLSIQPTLAECGNLMRAMLYMYYGGHQENNYTEADKRVARRLHAFILAAKA